MIKSRSFLLVSAVFLFGLMQGCTMVQTYPLAARAGDTITIAPGSLDGATKTNLTVQYYSDSNPSTPVNLSSNIRSVFNITPDRTSPVWTSSMADSIPASSGHGPWQTVIALDLPTTGLPLGPGNIRVTLGAGVVEPTNAHTVAGVNMALEILPGTGTPNLFQYMAESSSTTPSTGSLNDLMPGRQYVVKPNMAAPANNAYAAAEYAFYMPLRNISDGLSPTNLADYIRVILDAHPGNDAYQVGLRWRRDGDNIIVYVTSPQNQVWDRMTRFSVVLSSDAPFNFSGTATITSVKYFDVNGNMVATTPLPILQGINL
jgi:hypothetical protein